MSLKYTADKIKYNDGLIQTYTFGEGNKPVLLFPGFPHSGIVYMLLNEKSDLAKKYKFYTFDIPGWGGLSLKDSLDRTKSLIPQYLDIVSHVVSYYKLNDFSIISYSFGTRLAVEYVLINMNLVSKLVLISPYVSYKFAENTLEYKFIKFITKFNLVIFLNLYKSITKNRIKNADNEWIEPALKNDYITVFDNVDMKMNVQALREFINTDLSESISTLDQIPVLIINSKDESNTYKYNAHKLRTILKHEETKYIEGSHAAFLLSGKSKNYDDVFEFLD